MESPEFSKIIKAADEASGPGKTKCILMEVNHLYFYFYSDNIVWIEGRLPHNVLSLTTSKGLPGGNWTIRTTTRHDNGPPASPIIATFKIRNDALWFIYSLLKYRIRREKVGMLKKLWRSIRKRI